MESKIQGDEKCYDIDEDGYYKKGSTKKVFWLYSDKVGEHVFSFDKKKNYNLFEDFPHNLTKEEVNIFIKEEYYWTRFFKHRMDEAFGSGWENGV